MSQEIVIAGIGIAPEVLSTIITRAVEEVEGVACVGTKSFAANLVSALSVRAAVGGPAVEAVVEDDKLAVTVHLTVFFGYPFKDLAASVRTAVASAIDAQVGVEVVRVDVCIDGLVFPKE